MIRVKEESEKVGLKFNIQKNENHGNWFHHFITNRRRKVGTVADFIVLGSKLTVDGDCSHEIKRRLLLRRRAMTNLESMLKGSDIIWLKKFFIVKAKVFPVVMNRYESWMIKKLSAKELMLLSCGVGEDSCESIGQ